MQPASPAVCPLRLCVFAWNTVAVEILKLFLKINTTMNFRRPLMGWVLLAAALNGQRLVAAPPIETLARVHWSGLNQVSASSNATQFMKVWQLPPTKALAAQTLDKLSQAPWRLLHRNIDTNSAALLRPLLDDVVADESYLQIRSVTGRPAELAWAIRLDDRRAALWQTNLAAVLESLTGIRPDPAPQGHTTAGRSINIMTPISLN
jgi:hypothetical protein